MPLVHTCLKGSLVRASLIRWPLDENMIFSSYSWCSYGSYLEKKNMSLKLEKLELLAFLALYDSIATSIEYD